MQINLDGWAEYLEQAPSTHHRKRVQPVSCIVLHGTAGKSFENALMTMDVRQVSAHFLIDRNGRMAQLVSADRVAYHAGKSEWKGRKFVNDFSVGIEMVNRPEPGNARRKALRGAGYVWDPKHKWWAPPWLETQVQACAIVCAAICSRYGVAPGDITEHAEVSPGRKSDCWGTFPWERFHELLEAEMGK